MEKGCGLIVLLLCLLSVAWRGVNGEEGEPLLRVSGEDALMSWKLPGIEQDVVTILLDQGEGRKQGIFMGSVKESNMTNIFNQAYSNRINIFNSLHLGEVIFTLKNVSKSDAGRFRCVEGVADIPIIPNCGQMLVVVDKPQNCTVLASSAAVENEDLALECHAITTSYPLDHGLPMQVQWFDSEGSVLKEDTDKVMVQGSRLVIRSIQRHDKGLKFSCRSSDDGEMWSLNSDDFVIIPEYGPTEDDINMPRSEAAVVQSKPLQQECSALCNPPCTVAWRKLQGKGKDYVVDTEDGLLDFTSVSRNNDGEYRCVAENKHGSAYRTLMLSVRYPSRLEKLFVNGDNQIKALLNEGNNVTIRCEFDSNPAPTVLWYINRKTDVTLATDDLTDQAPVVVIDNVPLALYTSHYFMQNVQCSDTGRYVCKGENSFGYVSTGTVQLDVVCEPRNTYGDLRLKQLYLVPAKQPLFIRFQLEGYPRAKLLRVYSEDEQGRRRWVEKVHDYTVSSSFDESHPYLTTYELIMSKLKPEHFDRTYYFTFENTVDDKVLAFMLRERGAPKPPKNVTSTWTNTHSVHLRWLPGFHGGKPQTFTVHYHAGEPEESWEQLLVSVPASFEETVEESPKEMTVDGLNPGTSYTFYVTAINEYGNTNSSFLTVTTVATAAASADAGVIAGAIIGVIIVIIIVGVIIFVFVIRPRRKKATEHTEDSTREPMLTSTEDRSPVTAPRVTEEKPANSTPTDTTNNNAGSDPSSEPLVAADKPETNSPDTRERNQDGLIYADLDLDKSKESSPVPERKDAVNYETVVFSTQPEPPPATDANDAQPVDEEQPPKA